MSGSILSYQSVSHERKERNQREQAVQDKAALFTVLIGKIVGIVVLIILAWPGSIRTPSHAGQVNNAAMMLSAALERFRQEQGSYPHSLSELLPRYLDRIPQTTGWNYDPAPDRASYQLSYTLGMERATLHSGGTGGMTFTSRPIP